MKDMVKVEIEGVVKEYERGTLISTISKGYEQEYDYDIILAYKNHKLRELTKTVDQDCELSFVTTKEDVGHKTYVRGMTLLMLKAMYQEVGRENIEKIYVEFSIGNA